MQTSVWTPITHTRPFVNRSNSDSVIICRGDAGENVSLRDPPNCNEDDQ